jgi:hypothetical protein
VIDKAALVAFLRARADHSSVLVHAALMGLVARVERGDFDIKEQS